MSNKVSLSSEEEVLRKVLNGIEVTDRNYIDMKEALKPIFFNSTGFMSWARENQKGQIKKSILQYGEELLISAHEDIDKFMHSFISKASEINQGAQLKLFYSDLLSKFESFNGEKLSKKHKNLLRIIQTSLKADDSKVKTTAIMLVSLFAESSNVNSRKYGAGKAAEDAIELLFKHLGLKEGVTYRRQFGNQGAKTDFVVPHAEDKEVHNVNAFIAVQASSNDRTRMSSSELHRGAMRFLCSFNGCSASTKDTKDIGNDLAAGYLKDETYYVVIESERLKAIEETEQRVAEFKGKPEYENASLKLKWLKNYSLNYQEFSEKIKELATT